MKGFKYYISLLFLAFTLSNAAKAQITNVDDLSPFQLKRFAKSAERANDAFTAIFYYDKYHSLKPKDQAINYKLAELNRQVRNYPEARDLYKTISEKSNKKYPMAKFYYAQMLKATGDYKEAIKNFKDFKRYYNGKDKKTMNKMSRIEIEGCDSAISIIKAPLDLSIENLNSSINSPHIELSPVPVDEETFIYSSLRVDSLVYFSNDNVDTAMPVRQFYLAKKEGLDWNSSGLLDGDINIPGVETGNGVLSRDGQRFYFTRCTYNWQGEAVCAIYKSTKEGENWSKIEKLPPIVNDPNYTSTQPALGRTAKSDREIIFFVSNRPDGKGGLDIWYTIWDDKNDKYSRPRNLGSRINSIGDEMTPFYNLKERTLYFSSTGKPGIGGYDIFSAFGERRKWSQVKNVGYPLNSSYDDLYFTVGQTGESGFFVSNRPTPDDPVTCCDDIFSYRWNNYIRITVTGTIYPFEKDRFGRKRDLSGFDFMNPDKSIAPLENAKIGLYKLNTEDNEYVFMDKYTTSADGKYYFDLRPDEEYEFRMEGFQYFDEKMFLSTQFFNFSDTIEMPPTWVNVLTDKPIVLADIYYDFNSSELSNQAKNILDTTLLVLLKEAPEFIIEIGSHTDSVGEIKYNMELSQERAGNVVQYLISKGIPSERLVAKGYGPTKPVAPNYKPDGTDNPVGREMNRRTEFRIIGTLGGDEEDEDFDYR